MIYMYTGANGAGKTQYILRHAVTLRAGSDRPIYAIGVKGLDYPAAQMFPLEDVTKWEELPDNSIVIVDEAQDYIPRRDYKKPEPEWVKQLAKHRHRGFDFILGTPQAMMVDHFVRRLLTRHFHVKRKSARRSLVLEWDTYQDKPDDFLRQRQAQKSLRKLDAEMWKLYQSATLHTHRARLPWQVALLVVLVPFVCWMVWLGVSGIGDTAAAAEGAQGAPAPAPTAAFLQGSDGGWGESEGEVVVVSAVEWAAQFEPRVPGIPYSAPAYDGRPIVEVPVPLCMEVVGEHCRCYTQQVTRLDVDQETCLRIVRDGLFDPYRKAFHFTEQERQSSERAQRSDVPKGKGV